ncbi:MAG: WG repeat-containing protein [Cytophagales bacterium]|jgi:hypothetical protein|nr:WG repeat-containing protein [Cytophagales bacterium]MCA6420400.1 WG repeat-containing protein [Cytophagales bacterium]MCA6427046.1 WG repeat-containing protein [Cytophagales bacterium]MCA6433914.1 WG repeat-containing protein [Cytophagales bacterium]MCA6492593.1 WG repeat-containing protein [Chitinophagaceae bacterium]
MSNQTDQLIPFLNGSKYGFSEIDKTIAIDCIYQQAYPFAEFISGKLLAPVMLKNKWGFIDTSGEVIISPVFSDFICLSDDLFCFEQNNKWALYRRGVERTSDFFGSLNDLLAQPNIPERLWLYQGVWEEDYFSYKQGLFPCGKHQMNEPGEQAPHGFKNGNGDLVIPCIYDDVMNFCGGYAMVLKDRKWGFIDPLGNLVVDFLYDKVCYGFSEGLAAVAVDGKVGFIDTNGNTAIPFKYLPPLWLEGVNHMYNRTYMFCNGLAIIHVGYQELCWVASDGTEYRSRKKTSRTI